ncbi:hypothetical protein RFI_23237 [Reticulomyxa filosa]|uniref:N-acetyltransferase ESCO acetyl-transferase domain-containing protein n=1 Tax=Reticulomyxa filosa TaxID=46433 RepID=X6MM12_RETFI|nr:hypothetical protein RFI_23237 [Reticulomyxa filosa]|eukprot:ETO14130.1 hypothetical protein RFI_23237 [Reticulomyxa filosa]
MAICKSSNLNNIEKNQDYQFLKFFFCFYFTSFKVIEIHCPFTTKKTFRKKMKRKRQDLEEKSLSNISPLIKRRRLDSKSKQAEEEEEEGQTEKNTNNEQQNNSKNTLKQSVLSFPVLRGQQRYENKVSTKVNLKSKLSNDNKKEEEEIFLYESEYLKKYIIKEFSNEQINDNAKEKEKEKGKGRQMQMKLYLNKNGDENENNNKILYNHSNSKILFLNYENIKTLPKNCLIFKLIENMDRCLGSDVGESIEQNVYKSDESIRNNEYVYIYVNALKEMIGCVVCESIKCGHYIKEDVINCVLMEKEEEDNEKNNNNNSNNNSIPCYVGIVKLWVHSKYRKRGIASTIIDTLRQHFIYGIVIKKHQVAFSQPTHFGRIFATHYCQNPRFLIY